MMPDGKLTREQRLLTVMVVVIRFLFCTVQLYKRENFE